MLQTPSSLSTICIESVLQMLTLRNLNLLDRPVPEGHIQSWFWHGASTEEAIHCVVPDRRF